MKHPILTKLAVAIGFSGLFSGLVWIHGHAATAFDEKFVTIADSHAMGNMIVRKLLQSKLRQVRGEILFTDDDERLKWLKNEELILLRDIESVQ